MKLWLTVIAAALSIQAHATSPIMTLASVHVSGGMPYPGLLAQLTLTISEAGEVEVAQSNYDQDNAPETPRYSHLGRLSAARLAELREVVARLRPGRLIDNPADVECADGPILTYQVYQDSFEGVTIAENYACRDHVLKDSNLRVDAENVRAELDRWLERVP